jgi:hypothetical protein
MSYCLNPNCQNPQNLGDAEVCQSCGSKLLDAIAPYNVIIQVNQAKHKLNIVIENFGSETPSF